VTLLVDVQAEVKQPLPSAWKVKRLAAKSSSSSSINSVDTSSSSGSVNSSTLMTFDHNAASGSTTVDEKMDTACAGCDDTSLPKTGSVTVAASTAVCTGSNNIVSIPVPASVGATTVTASWPASGGANHSAVSAAGGGPMKQPTDITACTATTVVNSIIPTGVSAMSFKTPRKCAPSGGFKMSSTWQSASSMPASSSSTSSFLMTTNATGGKTRDKSWHLIFTIVTCTVYPIEFSASTL